MVALATTVAKKESPGYGLVAGLRVGELSQTFDLIIFDCDGVLVDSERVANEVFARVLDEVCGLQFTLDDMFDIFVGHSRLQCLQKGRGPDG